jgi:hypothetical protein
MKHKLEQSVKKFNATVQNLDVQHLEYYKYTKSYVKKSGISPDSLMQLAIQVGCNYLYANFDNTCKEIQSVILVYR